MKNIIIVAYAIVLLVSCNSENKQNIEESTSNYLDAVEQMKSSDVQKITALEVIDVDSYTYLKVDENGKKFWMAIMSRPVEKGKQYYYKESIMMYDFASKQLNRTFDSIMFITDFSDQPFVDNDIAHEDSKKIKTDNPQNKAISIDLPKGGISLADIYKNKDQYDGKSVVVRGVVVKMNEMIMGKNWIHLQDGSNHEGFFDLTITTKEAFEYALGDTITFQGNIALNKDFGAGYKYDIIMEEGHLKK
ncbi:MAG: hypothetical protein DRJ05_16215 [Bacteroidetes bacterium]|nr:MAG: hypothetical protein DRJ05_16215 [Bacteroidota bacterium]